MTNIFQYFGLLMIITFWASVLLGYAHYIASLVEERVRKVIKEEFPEDDGDSSK